MGALLNHSDVPNAVPIFQGQTLVFRAIRDIAAGSELTVSYIELAAPRLERRHMLAWNYFFDIDASEVWEPISAGLLVQGRFSMHGSGIMVAIAFAGLLLPCNNGNFQPCSLIRPQLGLKKLKHASISSTSDRFVL